jgi:hypothetical protein
MYFRNPAVWKCLRDWSLVHGNHVSYMLPILVMVSIVELQGMLERCLFYYHELKSIELLILHTVL